MPESKKKKEEIRFFVAECMEFQNLGVVYTNITLKEAVDCYKRLLKSARMMGPGIDFELYDGSGNIYEGWKIDLMSGGIIWTDIINRIEFFRNSQIVKDAIDKLSTVFEKEETICAKERAEEQQKGTVR